MQGESLSQICTTSPIMMPDGSPFSISRDKWGLSFTPIALTQAIIETLIKLVNAIGVKFLVVFDLGFVNEKWIYYIGVTSLKHCKNGNIEFEEHRMQRCFKVRIKKSIIILLPNERPKKVSI